MQEVTIDLQNYAADAPVFRRTAVRGIICRDGKYLLIHSKYGDYKFPGGGMEQGESLTDTLIREVREETGYAVVPESIHEFLLVHEQRKGERDDLLLMDSYYYCCDVSETAGQRNLDAYEQEYDYQTVWMTLEEAIAAASKAAGNLTDVPWVQREIMVMQQVCGYGV